MILDFSKIETVIPQFYGGEEIRAHMNIDKTIKFLLH